MIEFNPSMRFFLLTLFAKTMGMPSFNILGANMLRNSLTSY